jgi:glycosyltransferase involved in cell wall biosynthesis
MPLRILIDARSIRDFGIGTYIRNLVAGLGRIDRDNRYIIVAGPKDLEELPALPANFETAAYKTSTSAVFRSLSVPAFFRKFKANVHHIPLNAVPFGMTSPYVVTIHDMSTLLYDGQPGFQQNLRLRLFRRGLTRASRIIAVSEATRRDVMNTLGIGPDRINLVYNAPDPVFTAPVRSLELEESHRIMERYQINYPFLLYAGNIRPQKNIPRLIEAFAVLRGEIAKHPVYSNLRLVIIGDEISKYPAVRHAVFQSRVETWVRFLGFVPIQTLRIFYKAAAAFVFPSLYEGFGLPPLEAMACGTPVVSSNVSSLPEVVGDAAIAINPENVFDIERGMREALLDGAARFRCIERGFDQVRRFSWDRTARQVLEIYKEAAGERLSSR